MMKNPEHIEGFLKVFPNYKHQNRQDGFGCMKLSPKYLGPVDHGQPDLPPALNIENFHQYVTFRLSYNVYQRKQVFCRGNG
jgi:hypothetical protein